MLCDEMIMKLETKDETPCPLWIFLWLLRLKCYDFLMSWELLMENISRHFEQIFLFSWESLQLFRFFMMCRSAPRSYELKAEIVQMSHHLFFHSSTPHFDFQQINAPLDRFQTVDWTCPRSSISSTSSYSLPVAPSAD